MSIQTISYNFIGQQALQRELVAKRENLSPSLQRTATLTNVLAAAAIGAFVGYFTTSVTWSLAAGFIVGSIVFSLALPNKNANVSWTTHTPSWPTWTPAPWYETNPHVTVVERPYQQVYTQEPPLAYSTDPSGRDSHATWGSRKINS